jgi:hypothetical protein
MPAKQGTSTCNVQQTPNVVPAVHAKKKSTSALHYLSRHHPPISVEPKYPLISACIAKRMYFFD